VREVAHEAALREQARTLPGRHREKLEGRAGRTADAVVVRELAIEESDGAREERGQQAVATSQRVIDELLGFFDQQSAEIGGEGLGFGLVRQRLELPPLNMEVVEDFPAALFREHA
jgi:hypothetical protein